MNKWGYEVVDQLTWIKTKNKKIHISHGFYFLHSSEVCLVGYKCPPNEYIEFKSKVSNIENAMMELENKEMQQIKTDCVSRSMVKSAMSFLNKKLVKKES